MNTSNANLGSCLFLTDTLIENWKNEIRSQGDSFNFDSQDIYKAYLNYLNSIDFTNHYAKDIDDERRTETISFLVIDICEIITIYEKHRDFFTSLDRIALQLKKYRSAVKSMLPDAELLLRLHANIELTYSATYYKSEFYQEIGFLSKNFHHEIYLQSKLFLADLKKNLKEFENYEDQMFFINNKPLFPMALICQIHSISNGKVFEEISEINFYNEINFLHAIHKLKIRKDHKIYFFYIVHLLSSTLIGDEREKWLHFILKDFQIERSYYKSKYKQVTWASKGKDAGEYRDLIDEIFKLNRVL